MSARYWFERWPVAGAARFGGGGSKGNACRRELGEKLEDGVSSGRLLKQVLSRPGWVSLIDCMKGDSEAELDVA